MTRLSSSSATAPRIHRLRFAAILVLVVVALVPTAVTRAGQDTGGKRDLRIYTQNLYVGTEFYDILSAETPEELFGAVSTAYHAILASEPAERMRAVAEEIAAQKPDIVTLQEVSTISRLATGETVDYLDLLLDSLDDLGVHYRAAVVATELDLALPQGLLPDGSLDYVELTDREAILVRTDLPPGYLRVSNPKSGQFETALPIFEGLDVPRGWCSVDVFVRGRTFRVIDAHLEEELWPEVRDAQAVELLAGPADVDLPVFLAGDLNSDPGSATTSGTYDILADAGFSDPWTELHGDDPGLTWGHDMDLGDTVPAFVFRIDLILDRGGRIVPTKSEVRDLALDREEAPFWASDHAGLVTTFRLK